MQSKQLKPNPAQAPNQGSECPETHTQRAIRSMPVYMREHVQKYSYMAIRLSDYRKNVSR